MDERLRAVAIAIGVAALAGGVLTVTGAGGRVGGVSVVLYAGGGTLGVLATYAALRDWVTTPTIDPPAVERAIQHPAPGDRFDRTLAQFGGDGRGHLPDRNAIHDRVRELATTVLARRRGCTLGEAHEEVRAGEWPADAPRVAAFLADPDVGLPRSLRDRLLATLGRDARRSDFQRLVGWAVDAVATRSAVEGIGPDAPPSEVVLEGQSPDRAARTTRWPEGVAATDGRGGSIDDPPERIVDTGRWAVAAPVGLAFVGYGFLLQESAVVLAGAVALGLVGYARATTPPDHAPTVERTVERTAGRTDDGSDDGRGDVNADDTTDDRTGETAVGAAWTADDVPSPGEAVEVTVTVRNDGPRRLPDLTVVDGVPPGLSVTDGSPRLGTSLAPGQATTYSYAVTARRGVHEFGPAYTVARDRAGTSAHVRHRAVADGSDTDLRCVPAWDALPVPVGLYERSGDHLGRLPAGGGEGVEFHSTREYRPGDALNRIDWKHLARSVEDEMVTVNFQEERAATVALVVDTYPFAYVAAGPDDPGAVEHSVTAASRLCDSLLATGEEVGLAALGERPLWVRPGSGADHRRRLTQLLATDPALPPTPGSEEGYDTRWVREFHRRFPAETQVILLSPLCDSRYRFQIRELRGLGHPVTVVSPDPTVDGTVGRRLTRVERRLRIESLRESGVRVVDWDTDEELAVAIGRAGRRWA